MAQSKLQTQKLKIKKITPVGVHDMYDISVSEDGVNEYILANGLRSSNTGLMYSADTVIIIGRRQQKEGTEVTGYDFILNIEKSRFVKEKSKIPISVTFEGGIKKTSGLLEVALELGYVIKPKNGWYRPINPGSDETEVDDKGKIIPVSLIGKNVRAKDTDSLDFWKNTFAQTDFASAIERRYKLAQTRMLEEEDSDGELEKLAAATSKLEELENE